MKHRCGASIVPGQLVCLQCLQQIIPDDIIPEAGQAPSEARTRSVKATPVPAPSTASKPAQQAENTAICPACGRRVSASTGRCPFDGEALRPAIAASWVAVPGGYQAAITETALTLGRLSEDESIADGVNRDEVSKRHASLRLKNGTVWLQDLGSTNGTWLAGKRVEGEVRLPPGDSIVGLGRGLTVTVHVS